MWLGADSYKLALYTSAGVLIWTVDNISTNGSNLSVTDHTGDGTTTAFAVDDGFTAVYINGVYQNRNTYVVTSGTVTFSEAPPLTSIIEVVYN